MENAKSYNTPHEAAAANDTDGVRSFNLGLPSVNPNAVDINSRDTSGKGVMHYAAAWGNMEILEYLFNRRADVNITDLTGASPLHYAAQEEQIEAAKALALREALTNLQDKDGWTPLHYAVEKNNPLLIDAVLPVVPENFIIAGRRRNIISRDKYRLRLKTLNASAYDGWTPLHIAADKGYEEIVKKLLEIGAISSITQKNKQGLTPLYIAKQRQFDHILKLLAEKKQGGDMASLIGYGLLFIIGGVLLYGLILAFLGK